MERWSKWTGVQRQEYAKHPVVGLETLGSSHVTDD